MSTREKFRKFAHRTSVITGSPIAFGTAIVLIGIWLLLGPVYRYSDTWQLIINTSTTIITFLMVFLIQNTQNRDSGALHLKLDELIRAVHGARNELVELEEMTDEELDELRVSFKKLHDKYADHLTKRKQKSHHQHAKR